MLAREIPLLCVLNILIFLRFNELSKSSAELVFFERPEFGLFAQNRNRDFRDVIAMEGVSQGCHLESDHAHTPKQSKQQIPYSYGQAPPVNVLIPYSLVWAARGGLAGKCAKVVGGGLHEGGRGGFPVYSSILEGVA